MAERGLSHAVGDALVALLDWAWPKIESRVDAVLESVADAVRPQPPMTIRTLSGEILTGLLVADRGQVVLFVGTRSMSGASPVPRVPSPYEPKRPPFDEALWPEDMHIEPYGRHR